MHINSYSSVLKFYDEDSRLNSVQHTPHTHDGDDQHAIVYIVLKTVL